MEDVAVDRRSVGRGMFALGVAAVLAPAARAAPAGTKTVVVSVGPGPGSELEADDAEVTAVRSSLTALLRQDPSCSAGKVGDVLEDSFASVEEHRSDVQYIWYYINGQWVHRWELLTEFEVDFGSGRTVLVSVEESEPKPI